MIDDRNVNSNTAMLQKGLLKAIKEFDSICRLHDIKYSLHGGTLLGAVREGGFIPWDNDVDITLMRVEYKKLIGVIKQYESIFVLDELSYNWTKVWLTDTKDSKYAAWIDIIVYDYTFNNRCLMNIKTSILVFFLGIRKTNLTMSISEEKWEHGMKLFVAKMLYYLGRLFPQRLKKTCQDWFAESFASFQPRFMQRANDCYNGIKLIISSRFMDDYIDILFENHILMITKNAHEVLLSCYGDDYMVPRRDDASIVAHERIIEFGCATKA